VAFHDRAFWLYLLYLLAIGIGIVSQLLATQHPPGLELRESVVVLETDSTGFSLQRMRSETRNEFDLHPDLEIFSRLVDGQPP
jgi:hypothetical protein